MEYLKFSISNSTYLIDAEDVISVERFSEIDCRDLVSNAIWRDKPVVVIDLEKLFSGKTIIGHRLAFVLRNDQDKHYIYLVNKVFGLVNINNDNFNRLNLLSDDLKSLVDASFFDSESNQCLLRIKKPLSENIIMNDDFLGAQL